MMLVVITVVFNSVVAFAVALSLSPYRNIWAHFSSNLYKTVNGIKLYAKSLTNSSSPLCTVTIARWTLLNDRSLCVCVFAYVYMKTFLSFLVVLLLFSFIFVCVFWVTVLVDDEQLIFELPLSLSLSCSLPCSFYLSFFLSLEQT